MATFSIWELLLRVGVAVLCGGVIGLERGRKRRPAGFRTYMLVCVGAAMTMILSTYLTAMILGPWSSVIPYDFAKTDVSRFGAQVINGIGFLGAGTIIVTGRQQIKGMTTAAGLWASACMGLAIGAGFYMASLICCVLIILTIVVFSKLETLILSHSRNINVYVEFENTDDISDIIEKIKSRQVKIFDVEITRIRSADGLPPCAIYSVRLPKKLRHADLMAVIATISGVQTVEEL
jgi:putative Mg2+ transporter-C (MgtC) family protein